MRAVCPNDHIKSDQLPIDQIKSELISSSAQETYAIGKKLAGFLGPGSLVALFGVLGSGKTRLTKGIACGLGLTENITSPTYTIINEYDIQLTVNNEQLQNEELKTVKLYHIDAYRLENEKDFEDIGGLEILESGGISIIEWSERIQKCLSAGIITVSIEITGESSRLIKITGLDKQL